MYQFYFEKLHVWQNIRDFNNEIYILTKSFPEEEKFNIVSQIRRAAVSTLINLAEGSSRSTKKDQAHFTTISYSSLMEMLSLLIVCYDQKYIQENKYIQLREQLNHIANQLNALKRSQLSSINN